MILLKWIQDSMIAKVSFMRFTYSRLSASSVMVRMFLNGSSFDSGDDELFNFPLNRFLDSRLLKLLKPKLILNNLVEILILIFLLHFFVLSLEQWKQQILPDQRQQHRTWKSVQILQKHGPGKTFYKFVPHNTAINLLHKTSPVQRGFPFVHLIFLLLFALLNGRKFINIQPFDKLMNEMMMANEKQIEVNLFWWRVGF